MVSELKVSGILKIISELSSVAAQAPSTVNFVRFASEITPSEYEECLGAAFPLGELYFKIFGCDGIFNGKIVVCVCRIDRNFEVESKIVEVLI